MNTEQLTQMVVDTLDDFKAQDITTLDVRELTQIMDTMVICCGTSKRHLKTLSEQLVVKAKQNGVKPLGVEGEGTGEWVLVDLADVVVHIMMPETRQFYSLEKLWSTTDRIRKQES